MAPSSRSRPRRSRERGGGRDRATRRDSRDRGRDRAAREAAPRELPRENQDDDRGGKKKRSRSRKRDRDRERAAGGADRDRGGGDRDRGGGDRDRERERRERDRERRDAPEDRHTTHRPGTNYPRKERYVDSDEERFGKISNYQTGSTSNKAITNTSLIPGGGGAMGTGKYNDHLNKKSSMWDNTKPSEPNLAREQARQHMLHWNPHLADQYGPGGSAGNNRSGELPELTPKQLLQRTLIIQQVPVGVTSQDLIDFFNGAVLAMTGNPMEMATGAKVKPVFAVGDVTTDDVGRGGGGDSGAESSGENESGERGKKEVNPKKVPNAKKLIFRSYKGTVVGMKLEGIEYKKAALKISRPVGFDEEFAKVGGKPPQYDIATITLADLLGTAETEDGKKEDDDLLEMLQRTSGRLSIQQIPSTMSEKACRELLGQFGGLKSVNLIQDATSGKARGYGFFEYDKPEHAALAVCLNGFVVGDRALKVTRLNEAAKQAGYVAAAAGKPVLQAFIQPQIKARLISEKILSNPVLALQVREALSLGKRPTTVVQLLNAVYESDLMTEKDCEDIRMQILKEAEKCGTVEEVQIPRPSRIGAEVEGVGKIFIKYADLTAARKFQAEVNGRKFDDRIVCAAFYPVKRFQEGRYILQDSVVPKRKPLVDTVEEKERLLAALKKKTGRSGPLPIANGAKAKAVTDGREKENKEGGPAAIADGEKPAAAELPTKSSHGAVPKAAPGAVAKAAPGAVAKAVPKGAVAKAAPGS